MIGRVHDNRHRAADGVIIPDFIVMEHFFNAAIGIFQFGFERRPIPRESLFQQFARPRPNRQA